MEEKLCFGVIVRLLDVTQPPKQVLHSSLDKIFRLLRTRFIRLAHKIEELLTQQFEKTQSCKSFTCLIIVSSHLLLYIFNLDDRALQTRQHALRTGIQQILLNRGFCLNRAFICTALFPLTVGVFPLDGGFFGFLGCFEVAGVRLEFEAWGAD